MAINNNTKQFGEIFAELKEAKKEIIKVNILRENDSVQLRQFLRLLFDTRLKFALPEGVPPYKKSGARVDTSFTTLQMEWKRIYMFIEGGANQLKQAKRESLFISLLESLSDQEAELLCELKDRTIKGITLKQVRLAFPDFPKIEIVK